MVLAESTSVHTFTKILIISQKLLSIELFTYGSCVGETQKCAKLMALGPMWRWPAGNKAINLDFWAPFLCYFFFAKKESRN